MITRRKDYSKSEPTKDASKIYIVCEGKGTEPDYFGFFEGLSSNLELIVIPPDSRGSMRLQALLESPWAAETRQNYQAMFQRQEEAEEEQEEMEER